MKQKFWRRPETDEVIPGEGKGGVLTAFFFSILGLGLVLVLGYLSFRYLLSKLGVIWGLE